MPEPAAFLFPGQGAQRTGMGADVAAASSRARDLFDRADAILGVPLSRICFQGPDAELTLTVNQQPAIFVTSLACIEALRERGALPPAAAAAGLSLGEYTALVHAGAMTFEAGLRLVRERGRLMQEASDMAPSGMLALVGTDPQQATNLCDTARGADILEVANFLAPGQVVISGSAAAIDRAAAQASGFGIRRALRLPVAGAFHSPLMAPAAESLLPFLEATEIRPPEVPFYTNVTGGRLRDPAEIRRALAAQVVKPVLFQTTLEALVREGIRQYVEPGPGTVLAGLLRRADASAVCRPAATAADIDAF